jgi:hypothetical protein
VDPIVRYFIVCEGVGVDPDRPNCTQIDCLMNSIRSLEDPPFPLLRESICVLLVLTGCRGQGTGQIRVAYVDDEQERPIFGTPVRPLDFTGRSPLDAVGVSYMIRDCPFPRAGQYSLQFWYNGRQLAERPLELR